MTGATDESEWGEAAPEAASPVADDFDDLMMVEAEETNTGDDADVAGEAEAGPDLDASGLDAASDDDESEQAVADGFTASRTRMDDLDDDASDDPLEQLSPGERQSLFS